MRVPPIRPSVVAGIALVACVVLAPHRALAQQINVVKFPEMGGDVQQVPGFPGQFIVNPGGTIRWVIEVDNSMNFMAVTYQVLDDTGAGSSCDRSGAIPACPGQDQLELLCPSAPDPDAPDPANGIVAQCDEVADFIQFDNVSVPAFGFTCVEFSTRVSGTAMGQVGNVGCVVFPMPIGEQLTRPTQVLNPTCSAPHAAAPTPACSNVNVSNVAQPDFSAFKTAVHADTNPMNGQVDVGETIQWTVRMVSDSTDPQTGFVFDPIPLGTTFTSIDVNPDGTCVYDMVRDEVQCPSLMFDATDGMPGGPDEKTLVFTTTVTCAAVTDDDGRDICNQASVCTDAGQTTCFQSDDDDPISQPLEPTCVEFRTSNLTTSTKTYSVEDVDMDGTVSMGDRATFTITVNNTGRADATNVVVTDNLVLACIVTPPVDTGGGTFDGFGTITWNLGTLLARDGTATVSFIVTLQDSGMPTCCNVADINSDERIACGLRAIQTPASCIPYGPQALVDVDKDFTITMDANGDGVADVGDEVEFTVTVTNVGGAGATNVDLTDQILQCFDRFDPALVTITGDGTNRSEPPMPPSSAGRVIVDDIGGVDGLLPAESVTITWRVTVAVAMCCNQATVTHPDALGGTVTVSSDDPTTGAPGDATCLVRTPASLTVTKTAVDADMDGCSEPGEAIAYTIDVSALGGTATGVTLVDAINDPSNVLTVTDPGTGTFDPVADTITWNLGDMTAGTTQSLQWTGTLDCAAANGTLLSDTATATRTNGADASDTWSGSVEAPVLSVTKTATFTDTNGNGTLQPGETVNFTITIDNVGSCAAANVRVVDAIDPDLDWGTVAPGNGGTDDGMGGVQWDRTTTASLASIGPAASVVLTVTGVALDPGTNPQPGFDAFVNNSARATADASFGCAAPEGTGASAPIQVVVVAGAQLSVVKTVTEADADGCNEPGETLTFSLEVTCTGGTASNVTLVDLINDPLAVLVVDEPIPDMGAYDPVADSVTWTIGTMGDGEVVRRSWTASVTCDAQDQDSIGDVATALSTDAMPGSDSWAGTVNAPQLDVIKSAVHDDVDMDGRIDGGEALTFTISIENFGTCEAVNVLVLDAIDPDLDWAGITASDGGTDDGGGNVTWDPTTTPSLASLGVGVIQVLTVASPALDPGTNMQPGFDQVVDNEVIVIAENPDPALCDPGTFPPLEGRGSSVPLPFDPGGVQIDLLRNATLTTRSYPGPAFSPPPTPNTSTCGETSLDTVADVYLMNVTLPGSFVIVGDGTYGMGQPVIFYEFTEYCPTQEGGGRQRATVTRQGGDVVVNGF
jgi:uncharacterized repeat protein (TIGR01451 family)